MADYCSRSDRSEATGSMVESMSSNPLSRSPLATSSQVLWEEGDRVFCGAWQSNAGGMQTAVLALRPVAGHPTPASLERFAHEYSMQAELNTAWAVRPLEVLREGGRILLVLEDSGGEPLDRLPRRWCLKTRSSRSW